MPASNIMLKQVALCSLLVLGAASVSAQGPNPTPSPIPVPADRPFEIGPGEEITDSEGRVIKHDGVEGRLIVFLNKRPRRDGTNWVCDGKISKVWNPSRNGAKGPINIDTNGKPTLIDLDESPDGGDPPIEVNVEGGNAEINVDGNNNEFNVGGTGNEVHMNGNNNSGSGGDGSPGSGAGTGGSVTNGGRGNNFNSNGGNWNYR